VVGWQALLSAGLTHMRAQMAVVLLMAFWILGSGVAFGAISVTQYAGPVSAPSGAVWLPGPTGTAGHLWISDASLGFCRVDATGLAACNASAHTPGQVAFDSATSSVYLPDSALNSAGVYRLHFNQSTETIDAVVQLRPTDGLGGNRPTSVALDPTTGALYVGFSRTPNIVRITNPSVGVGDPKVTIGNSSDNKESLALAMLDQAGVVSLVEADSLGLGRISNVGACSGSCKATPINSGIAGPLSLAVQSGTTLLVGTPSSVVQFDPTAGVSASNPLTLASGLNNVTAVSVDPTGTIYAGTLNTIWSIAQVVVSAPGTPTAVAATAGDAQASVTWTAPLSDGGSPITSYTVTSSPAGGSVTVTAPAAGGTVPTTATVTGLTNGTAYTFTVTATNTVGSGPASLSSNSVTPAAPAPALTAPGAPTAVTATAGDAQASVTWTAPLSDGGSPITSYTVTSSPAGASVIVTPPAAGGAVPTTATVTGLTNGTAYTFSVTATNAAGTGAASANSNSVTPIGLPGAPTAVSATAGSGQASVTWTAPLSDGGSPITSYTVTSSPAGGSVIVTAPAAGGAVPTQSVVSGLVPGTAYTFSVTAANAAGTGAGSTPSNSVTPFTLPGAPTAV
jgi:fibronectin type III domain protein